MLGERGEGYEARKRGCGGLRGRNFVLQGSGCGILALELRDRCLRRRGRGLCLLGAPNEWKYGFESNRDIDREEALNEILHPAAKRTGL